MPKALKFLLALAVAGVLAYIVTSTSESKAVSCEVCVDFKGRKECRTARGPTRDQAIVTARDNACAQIVNGRTENILCGGGEPASVRCSE
jgi:hypothetical protein